MTERRDRLWQAGVAVAVGVLVAGVGALAEPAPAPAPPTPHDLSVLPPGEGRDAVIKVCAGCHAPAVVVQQRRSEQGWIDVVMAMVGRGARATDDELERIVDYLVKTFPEEKHP